MKKGEMLNAMLVIATNAHAGQYDKGGKPYILHPLAVMQILNSDDEELQCIALAHDLFEDTKVTANDLLNAGMTQRIIDGIYALTKMPGQSYEEYVDGIIANKDAVKVKMADLTHNTDIRRLKGITDKDLDRMQRYQKLYWTLLMVDNKS